MLGLVVAPNCQGQGIAGRLLNYFENLAKNQHRHGVTLTCRESLISFYENMGIVMKVYQNHVMAVLNGITLLKI
ncbi:acetyltransferase (GNAT) family protein [Staphylococcus aureus]|uniref:Acetyltransferase (GNAT) family protein n=1 Tax=Staphylococcus aureus TaxID=1280 RepID=A0A380DZX1_STAAU|nr:acetyltransferase (GNAT) family protein [Staphylococcus aureus]